MITIFCKFKKCRKKIKIFPSRIGRRKYCSYSCRAKDNLNKTFLKGHKWVGKIKNIDLKHYHSQGYILIYSPYHPYKNKRNEVLEHRLVMEKYIGRYLLPKEVVHHKNRNRGDNRIENLELFLSNSDHLKHEYKTSIQFRKSLSKNHFKKGQVALFKGKRHTEATKMKMRKSKKIRRACQILL